MGTDVIFRDFHLLEKATDNALGSTGGGGNPKKKVKAIRPFPLVTKPIQTRKKICHRLELNHFDEVLPKETIDSFDIILGLVIMDIDVELPHFSLLVIDNIERVIRHFCSLNEKLETTRLKKHLEQIVQVKYTHIDVKAEHHQEGSYDCGLFVCQNAKRVALMKDSSDRITQENM